MKRYILAFVLCILATQVDVAQSQYPDIADGQLLYADVIVRGVIDSIKTVYTKDEDYFPESPRPKWPLATTLLKLRIDEVLRGRLEEDTITVAAPGRFPPGTPDTSGAAHMFTNHSFGFVAGEEVVYCLWHNPLRPTEWLVPPDQGRFVHTGDQWVEQLLRSKYSIEKIRRIVADGSASYVSEQADLIVSGRVLDVQDGERIKSPEMRETIRMTVDKVWKGSWAQNEIEFTFSKYGPIPERIPTPDVYGGERWLMFLRSVDGKLQPFAGLNGMLRMKDTVLMRNRFVPYEVSGKELEGIIATDVISDGRRVAPWARSVTPREHPRNSQFPGIGTSEDSHFRNGGKNVEVCANAFVGG